ncbi:MAG: hypothetical protein RI910_1989 [Verrucomicrobiota bacterium]|jgi:hypothetical protein
MHIIKPDSMPRFWWLVPWSYARTLKTALNAMKAYADRADRTIEMQIRIIDNYRAETDELKTKLQAAEQSRTHWIAKAERAHAVAMHNEKVIREMEERSQP